MAKKTNKLLKSLQGAVATLVQNPIILYPLCVGLFIQLLIMEILYFSTRWPLSVFFGPLIRYKFGEAFMHYPFNFDLIPRLYYSLAIPQILYVFVETFLGALAISLIVSIREDKTATLKMAFRKNRSRYFQILAAAFISLLTVVVFLKGYDLVFRRALAIRSAAGPFFILRRIVVEGRPYFNLLLDIFASFLFIFVVPVIVIEKKNVLRAIALNFGLLRKTAVFMFGIVLIPALFYAPILMVRNIIAPVVLTAPYVQGLVLAFSAFVKFAIEAIVLTATTTFYLSRKENS